MAEETVTLCRIEGLIYHASAFSSPPPSSSYSKKTSASKTAAITSSGCSSHALHMFVVKLSSSRLDSDH
jgi:hypothetical protein